MLSATSHEGHCVTKARSFARREPIARPVGHAFHAEKQIFKFPVHSIGTYEILRASRFHRLERLRRQLSATRGIRLGGRLIKKVPLHFVSSPERWIIFEVFLDDVVGQI